MVKAYVIYYEAIKEVMLSTNKEMVEKRVMELNEEMEKKYCIAGYRYIEVPFKAYIEIA